MIIRSLFWNSDKLWPREVIGKCLPLCISPISRTWDPCLELCELSIPSKTRNYSRFFQRNKVVLRNVSQTETHRWAGWWPTISKSLAVSVVTPSYGDTQWPEVREQSLAVTVFVPSLLRTAGTDQLSLKASLGHMKNLLTFTRITSTGDYSPYQ